MDVAMQAAMSIVDLISALCRGAWDEKRTEAYAMTLVGCDVPLGRLSETARWLLTVADPDDITPARLISEAKKFTPRGQRALPAPENHTRVHLGEGIGGNRPPVFIADDWSRKRMLAQYSENLRASGRTVNRPNIASEARRLGQDSSRFEDEEPPRHEGGQSLSELVASVVERRRVPF